MKMAADMPELISGLREDGVTDDGVLAALESLPREMFLPDLFRERAYDDVPL